MPNGGNPRYWQHSLDVGIVGVARGTDRMRSSPLNLRVCHVNGQQRYRDFGDKVQYEGPYDFHTEAEMSILLDKLKHIRAKGGDQVEL